MDFDALKVEGGSSALERTVKTFAGAGIANKVIALFDNDAAGRASLSNLQKSKLPTNYSIIKLPDISIAKAYPTFGPQGSTIEDVNGRACSIELYLGVDVLMNNGVFIPVHWKSVEHSIKAYQGEIEQKNSIHEAFKKKLKKAVANNGAVLPEQDWKGLHLIYLTIFQEASKF